ncbi:MAG TPA: hypothetical protein VFA65_07515 [Bryobacteraceae bacterium]|nr:hypothetical protein [Bryobacteraceae bacterium]
MAVSQRQLAANRANAQKSTGPRTDAGKEKVAQNALKHGLCGNFQVLSCEDQQQYDDFFQRFLQTENPADDVERELVAKMARHTWLSERAMRCQEGCFLVQPQTPEDQQQNTAGIAVRTDLEMYVRYQAAQDRAYSRASAELARRRNERAKVENGFVSQQRREAREIRAQAEEERRRAREKRRAEKHVLDMAIRKARLERLSGQAARCLDNKTEIATPLHSRCPDNSQMAQAAQSSESNAASNNLLGAVQHDNSHPKTAIAAASSGPQLVKTEPCEAQ